jgi:hypothetical protein
MRGTTLATLLLLQLLQLGRASSKDITALQEEIISATPTTSSNPNATSSGSSKPMTTAKKLPHIIMIVMDDLGKADLGIRGSGILTPNSDRLAKKGLQFQNYYVLPTCTTTRTAIMTGRYPYRMGQYEVIRARSARGMPLDEETLPEVLKKAGYQRHAVGKWHLGHSSFDYTPTFRGFESFYGFYAAGRQDYYKHTVSIALVVDEDSQLDCSSLTALSGARCL